MTLKQNTKFIHKMVNVIVKKTNIKIRKRRKIIIIGKIHDITSTHFILWFSGVQPLGAW